MGVCTFFVTLVLTVKRNKILINKYEQGRKRERKREVVVVVTATATKSSKISIIIVIVSNIPLCLMLECIAIGNSTLRIM